jgi:hypothetical protein
MATAMKQLDKTFVFVTSSEKLVSGPGLPDGTFASQKFQFWYILVRLGMGYFGRFYSQFVHFTANW